MATPLSDLKKVRLQKLNKIKKLGINPYAYNFDKQATILESQKKLSQNTQTAGRILAIRGHGQLVFADLIDQTGKIQLIFHSENLTSKENQLLPLLDIGDIVGVSGKVIESKTKEISIDIKTITLLSKCLSPFPSKWFGLKDIEERYRKRYLDVILNPEVKDRLLTRSKIITALREFLDSKDYIEVETPTLQPVYGGGFARPFVTRHNALSSDFYLRISDEMYLKRLIVANFEKVYEITKVFRNEGIDHDHNPEFTMFEAQIAYKDYNYGMDIIEEIFEFTAKKVLGETKVKYQDQVLNFARPWARLKLVEAVKKYTHLDPLSFKTLSQAKKAAQTLKLKKEKLNDLNKIQTIGEVIAFIFEEAVEEKLIQPTIIYDYPIEVSPLAKKCSDERFTQRFEMFVYGSELGNNYSELNDPIDLKQRFIEEKKREQAGFDEAHQTDDDYLEAIEHGFPPTCGIAIGIDRMVMMFTNTASIREVIAFPTLKPKVPVKKTSKK